MDLHLNSQNEHKYMKKFLFNLKTQRKDGLILTVNHSYSNSSGQTKKFRFIHASFDDLGTCLAIADHQGNVFVIDLELEKHWLLPHKGLVSFISFLVSRKQELLIGLETGCILVCNVETGNINNMLNGHSVPATEVSYTDDGYYCLTSCTTEAVVWDLSSYVQIHRLTLKPEASLKKVLFMPVTHHILACFQDDTLNVWQFRTFECIKQIIPEAWKTHNLRDIAFTRNGRAMVIGGHSPNLVVFCLDTWSIKKVIEFPENISGIKQLQFVPQTFDGGANKILAILTTSQELYFFDIETSTFLSGMHLIFGITSKPFSVSILSIEDKMAVNNNGKYLATIFTTGEINIYVIEKVFRNRQRVENDISNNQSVLKTNSEIITGRCSSKTRILKSIQSLNGIKKQLNEILDLRKIQPLLKEFGEYPEVYRILIWKTILKLPENQKSFCCLSTKECHPSYSNLELKYPLVNKSLCNSLKKLLSSLSHWCPLFGEVNFLPEFVFPFVKLFHSDPLGCFEVIATILVNWCQNWFEFYPFPPINMLSALENILGYHDPELLEFYLKKDITPCISMCPLFHTAFSEVLSKREWLKLWDHVLSNEPPFLFLAIVAYNIVCRNAIKSLKNMEDVEKFFHSQNPIDIKKLISKTYLYLKETPNEFHCRQFFTPFQPLSKGTYSSFSAYPKLIVDPSVEKLKTIRKEKEDILKEQMKALTIRKKLDQRLKTRNEVSVEKKLCRDLENQIKRVIEEEEDRLLNQRQKLKNLKQELRLKELEMLEKARNHALKEKRQKKELELERLIHDISKKKARETSEVDAIEEEVRNYYPGLLLKKHNLQLDLGGMYSEDDVQGTLDIEKELKHDLNELQDECNSTQYGKSKEIAKKMKSIKKLVGDLEVEVAKNMAETENLESVEFDKLKNKVTALHQQIEKLVLESLHCIRREQTETKLNTAEPTKESSRGSQVTSTVSYLKPRKNFTLEKNKKDKSLAVNAPKKALNGRYLTKKISIHKKRENPERINPQKFTNNFKDKKNIMKENKINKTHSPKFKTNFTCRNQNNEPRNLGPEIIGDFEKSLIVPSEDERSWTAKGKCTKHYAPGSSSKNFSKLDTEYLFQSDSENEIFKEALKTRKQLIEEAKRSQKL